MKKLTTLAALLAMLLVASVPVLAQQEETPPTATPAPAPAPAPAPIPAPAGITVGCQVLFEDPAALCSVDENGEITLPDGTTAPVLVRPDGTVFIQDTSGGLTLIGEAASFVAEEDTAGEEEDTAGDVQYDNA